MNRPVDYKEIWKQRLKAHVQPDQQIRPDSPEDSVKFLTNAIGEETGFVATFSGRNLAIHDVRRGQLKYRTSFKENHTIVDVDFLQLTSGRFACVAAVNSSAQSFVALLIDSSNNGTIELSIARCISIPSQKMTCLKVVLSESDEVYLARCNPRVQAMHNIIAVGTARPNCFIFGLGKIDLADLEMGQSSSTLPELETVKLVDGLRSNIEDEKFMLLTRYTDDDTALRISVDKAAVTCIGFFVRSSALVIGLQFGGLHIIHLRGEMNLYSFDCGLAHPIRALVNCEPDDDPRKHEHMMVMSWSEKGIMSTVLLEALPTVSVDADDQQPQDGNNENIFLNAIYKSRAEHVKRFVCARAIVHRRSDEDIQPQQSSVQRTEPELRYSRALVYFAYIGVDNNETQFMMGLFDLNMYFFKRLPHSITVDLTPAKQCPFLAHIYGTADGGDATHLLYTKACLYRGACEKLIPQRLFDVTIQSDAVDKFMSPCNDSDQLFYASALDFQFVTCITRSGAHLMCIPSLPAQALDHLSGNLVPLLTTGSGSSHVEILGLLSKTTLERLKEMYTDGAERARAIVLSSIVCNATAESVQSLQKAIGQLDWSICLFISEWIWVEIEWAKKTLDDKVSGLFGREMRPLGPEGESSLVLVKTIFATAIHIYSAINCKQANEQDRDSIPQSLISGVLHLRHNAALRLYEHCHLLNKLISRKFVPLTQKIIDNLNRMNGNVEEQRRTEGRLVADDLVAKMQVQTPNEDLWLDYAPQKWYPPALGNLLHTILLPNVSSHHKRKLLVYYFQDYFTANSSNENISEEIIQMLESILKIDRQFVNSIIAERAEMQRRRQQKQNGGQEEEHGEEAERKKVEQEVNEILQMARKGKLPPNDEEKLKCLLKQVPFGEYRYQLFLVNQHRYQEVDIDLPITNDTNKYVKAYAQISNGLRKNGRQAGADRSQSGRPLWDQELIRKLAAGQNASASATIDATDSPPIKKFIPKTPKNLWGKHRLSIANGQQQEASTPVSDTPNTDSRHSLDSTSKSKLHRLTFDEDDTQDREANKNVPSEEKQRIDKLLATPKDRVQRAQAAQAMHRLSFEKTPPQEANRMPPRTPASILKSGGRRGVEASPGRGRIKFDLPNLTGSSVEESPVAASSANEPPHRPNFDIEIDEVDDNPPSAPTASLANTTPPMPEPHSPPSPADRSSPINSSSSSPSASPQKRPLPEDRSASILDESVQDANTTYSKSSQHTDTSVVIERSFEKQPEEDEEDEPNGDDDEEKQAERVDGDWQGELDTAIMEDEDEEEEENFVDASDGRRAEQNEQDDKGDGDEENEMERTVTVTRKRAEERQSSEETAQNEALEQKQEEHAKDSDSPMGSPGKRRGRPPRTPEQSKEKEKDAEEQKPKRSPSRSRSPKKAVETSTPTKSPPKSPPPSVLRKSTRRTPIKPNQDTAAPAPAVARSLSRSLRSAKSKSDDKVADDEDSAEIYIRRQVNNHPLADKLSASTIKKIADDSALRALVGIKKRIQNRVRQKGEQSSSNADADAPTSSAASDRDRDAQQHKSPARKNTRKRSLSEQSSNSQIAALALPVTATAPTTPKKGRVTRAKTASAQKNGNKNAIANATPALQNSAVADDTMQESGLRRSTRRRTLSEQARMIAEQEEAVRIARETKQRGRKKTPTPSNTPSTSNAGSQPGSGKSSQDDQQHPTTSGIRRSTRKRSASVTSDAGKGSKPNSPPATPKRPRRRAEAIAEEDEE